MAVGTLEEIIDENHAIVSTSVGSEYYVVIMTFVDKDLLEPGCTVLLNHKVCCVYVCVHMHVNYVVLLCVYGNFVVYCGTISNTLKFCIQVTDKCHTTKMLIQLSEFTRLSNLGHYLLNTSKCFK